MPFQYYYSAIGVSIFFLIIFIGFHSLVPILKLSFWHCLPAISMCSLLAIQQIAIIYILDICEYSINNLDFVSDKKFINEVQNKFKNFFNFKTILFFNALVIIPFFILDVIQLNDSNLPLFYTWAKTKESLMLDFYNYLLVYLIDYFISIQLLINISLVFLIRDLDKNSYKDFIDLRHIDIENLKVSNLLYVSLTFYFISLTLAIVTYFGPFGLMAAQSYIYIALIIIGAAIFLIGRMYIKKIINDHIKDEKQKLFIAEKPHVEKFLKIIQGEYKTHKEDLEFSMLMLSFLNAQEKKLNNINIIVFNEWNYSRLFFSFASSVTAVYIKMTISSKIGDVIFLLTLYFAGYL